MPCPLRAQHTVAVDGLHRPPPAPPRHGAGRRRGSVVARLVASGRVPPSYLDRAAAIERAAILVATRTYPGTRWPGSGGRGGPPSPDVDAGLIDFTQAVGAFGDWVAAMRAVPLPVAPVLGVVVGGWSLGDVDRLWRRRKGWARSVIIRSLEIYPEG